ncbi:MAG: acyl carrier protein [Burkholderiales bacterium]|nr:acyl carrier protein [Burkholderiales bacterium]
MTTEELYTKLTPIFRDVFDDESLAPHPAMTAAEVESWDSLSNIRLIVDIEQRFKIHFTTAEITGLANVGELVAVIERKLVG